MIHHDLNLSWSLRTHIVEWQSYQLACSLCQVAARLSSSHFGPLDFQLFDLLAHLWHSIAFLSKGTRRNGLFRRFVYHSLPRSWQSLPLSEQECTAWNFLYLQDLRLLALVYPGVAASSCLIDPTFSAYQHFPWPAPGQQYFILFHNQESSWGIPHSIHK